MPAVNLTAYLKHKDKCGVEIGEWATQVGPGVAGGVAACDVCVPRCTIKFEKGRKELTNHSERAKHRKASENGNNNKPQSVADLFGKDKGADELRSKTRDLEIALVQSLSRHDVPPEFAECLSAVLKKYISRHETGKYESCLSRYLWSQRVPRRRDYQENEV